jgi:hypothetical protein
LAGVLAGAGIVFLIALGLAALQLGWQVATLDIADTRNCLARFRSNQLVGWALFLGLAADMGLAALVSAHCGGKALNGFAEGGGANARRCQLVAVSPRALARVC